MLPTSEKNAKNTVLLSLNFTIIDKVLYIIDHKKPDRSRAAMPRHLQSQILQEYHRGRMAGHFSSSKLYSTLCCRWWWQNMYTAAVSFCRNCTECAVTTGTGRGK